MKNSGPNIYLVSQSPRRRELLRQVGIEFGLLLLRSEKPRGPDVNEAVHPGELAHDYVVRIAREKAAMGHQMMRARQLPVLPILAADTTVVLDNKIFGKPADAAEATAMLQALSGRTHQVLTAVAVQHNDQLEHSLQISEVTFDKLTDKTIENYCATREPYDKAGGYGIQGLAAVFIKHISGSYSSIMGLPLHETTTLLQKAGIKIL